MNKQTAIIFCVAAVALLLIGLALPGEAACIPMALLVGLVVMIPLFSVGEHR